MADSLLGALVINEILVDPNGANNFDTDNNGTAAATDEYIELLNTSDASVNISGVELWDPGNDRWFTFPFGTVVAPGGRVLIVTGVQADGALPATGPDDLAFDAGRGTAILNNGSDNVVVYDPASDTFIQATYNGAPLLDPTDPANGFEGFSTTATQIGVGEDFGNDVDGLSVQRSPDGADTFTTDTPTPLAGNVCFCSGTLIATVTGPTPIEHITVGAIVQTADHGPCPVRWIASRTLSHEDLAEQPTLWPVRIRHGALGHDLPHADLWVSQQHRMLVGGAIARRMYAADDVLIAAKHLITLGDIEIIRPAAPVTFWHMMFERHEIVFANGAASESFFAGPLALRMIDQSARDELLDLFPALRKHSPTAARPFATGRKARMLVQRHNKNGKPLSVGLPDGWTTRGRSDAARPSMNGR